MVIYRGIDDGSPIENPEAIAAELDALVKSGAPGYSVQWNPSAKCWPDDEPGMFEVLGPAGAVHYRRRTPEEVKRLASR